MSLFSGIKFSSDTAKALAKDTAAAAAAANGPAATAGPSTTAISTAAPPTATSTGPSRTTSSSASSSSKTAAALQFAPRTKAKPKPSIPAAPRGFTGASLSNITSAAVLEAQPVLIHNNASTTTITDVAATTDSTGGGAPRVSVPAMTLAAAEKEKGKRKADSGGQQKRRKKKQKRRQQVVHTFQPDEEYDPNRPNDLGEYQHYRAKQREERRAAAAAAAAASDESSYYSDSSVEAPRRDAPRLFAPPKMYSPPPVRGRVRDDSPPPQVRPPPPVAAMSAQAQTGDNAYARRLAMSQAASGDDAYARRVAMSQQAQQRPPGPSSNYRPPPPPTLPMGGSMPPFPPTARPPPGPPITGAGAAAAGPPPFRPPPAHLLAGAPAPFRPPPAHLLSGAPPPPPLHHDGPPPTPHPVRFTAPSPPRHDAEYERQLEEKRKAAAAVAAKLAALVGTPQPAVPAQPVYHNNDEWVCNDKEDIADSSGQSGTFAEKMMRKWGHTEGQGLGVREDGIKHALAAEHIVPGKAGVADGKLSKRQLAKQRAAAANAKTNRKWTQVATSRGRIVNANDDERARDEHRRLGEASRILCITGFDDDDVGDELTDEVGDECSKHGIVERVLLHVVEPPAGAAEDSAPHGLRVFVVFSGMAGAWRAVRELDGRFFGGKKLSVRYFDEKRFDRGDRDGDL